MGNDFYPTTEMFKFTAFSWSKNGQVRFEQTVRNAPSTVQKPGIYGAVGDRSQGAVRTTEVLGLGGLTYLTFGGRFFCSKKSHIPLESAIAASYP